MEAIQNKISKYLFIKANNINIVLYKNTLKVKQ